MAHNSPSLRDDMVQVATGAAGQVAADIINKGFIAPIIEQINALIQMDRNNQFLQDKLERTKSLLQHISIAFENQQAAPHKGIACCLAKMRDAIQEGKDLSVQYEEKQKSPYPYWLFFKVRISTQITELNAKFDRLLQDLQNYFSIFANAQRFISALPPSDALLQPVPDEGFIGSGFEFAETQLRTWITAEAPQVRRIGVYGMPGVGKTSLLKRIYNFYKVSKAFDVVIWLTVSRVYEIRDLQGRIAEQLKLDLSRVSVSDIDTPKMRLSERMSKMKYLLVLDDIWNALDQQALGVGFGTDKGSRVVFSTRSRELTLTEAEESIKVEPLSRDEGWELFQRVAFKYGNESGHVPEELKQCARKIADECHGLPLAITVVAAVMRGKGAVVDDWNDCLSLMEKADPSFTETHPRVDEELYQKLRWSYDNLPKHLQNCFLYCALYPEDEQISVDELVRMWIAEGFFNSCGATYSMNMKKGHRYVKLLIDRCLFQSVNFQKQSNKPVKIWKKRFITVHDVIRDMAIHIGEKEENYLCRAGSQLKDFSQRQTQDCKRMSLHLNQIDSLPEDFLSRELASLIISKNPLAYDVRGSFLMNLNSLRILDLSNTQIESVPTSLTQLRVLDLSNTQIESVPTFLTQLECLTLRCTCIKELPKDIGNLSNLQVLDISDCKYLTSLPAEISKLTSLKRLHLNMGMENAVNDPANVMALIGLKNLKEFQLFMFFKFETHEIMGTIMGSWIEMTHLYLHYNHMNYVKCNLPRGMQNMKNLQSFVLFDYRGTNLPNWICEFQQLERLELDSCDNVKELPPLERLPSLKFLKLRKYSNVRDLGIGNFGIRSGDLGIGNFGIRSGFPKLEILHLSDMPKLRSIGVLEEGTLLKLHVLKVKKCPLLKKLPTGMEKLPNLSALYGHRISWWEKIIWEDHNMKICLLKLFKEV